VTGERPRVVIVGAGFGGLRAARALDGAPVDVVLVDRRNYHLFQPLLYQVATAGLAPEDIAHPVRAILRRQRNLRFRLAEVREVDLERRVLRTSTGDVPWDALVLTPGGATNWFGLDSVEAHGFGLKSIEEAVIIRNHVLRMFELAVQEADPDRRRAMLTFVVVGGGPTGVESAGALSELVRLVLRKDLRELDASDVRVVLLEATDRLLGPMPERLRRFAAEILWSKHVEVRFGAQVTRFDGERVVLKGGEVIPARTLVWAAGARAADLVAALPVERGPQGRVRVTPTLQVPGHDEVFVAGDAAYLEDTQGRPLPMMAPVARQQAELAARNALCLLRGGSPQPFRYRDPGSLATIGRGAAVARIGRLRFHGFAAWVAWLVVHIVFLIGFRNRLLVLINWAWDYLFYERAVRLVHAGRPVEGTPVREAEHAPPSEAGDPRDGGKADAPGGGADAAPPPAGGPP
jgi:NADH dehydrogenase